MRVLLQMDLFVGQKQETRGGYKGKKKHEKRGEQVKNISNPPIKESESLLGKKDRR